MYARKNQCHLAQSYFSINESSLRCNLPGNIPCPCNFGFRLYARTDRLNAGNRRAQLPLPEPPTPSSLAATSRWQCNYKSLYAHCNTCYMRERHVCENVSFILSPTTEHHDSKSSRYCFERAACDTCVTRCIEALIRYRHAWRRTRCG